MVNPAAISHFLEYLQHHPQHHPIVRGAATPTVALVADERYAPLAEHLTERLRDLSPSFRFEFYRFSMMQPEDLLAALDRASVFSLFYESFRSPSPSPEGAPVVRPYKDYMKKHWKRSVLFLDIEDAFGEIYGTSPHQISGRNLKWVEAASTARTLTIRDDRGGSLEVDLTRAKPWTNVDGFESNDLIPGEVATNTTGISGTIHFTGTFLSTLPFAIKYGVQTQPLTFRIEGGKVVDVDGENAGLVQDFQALFSYNSGNRSVDEVGVGTNPTVRLHGNNSAFEERHCGLHLGLGGAAPGSHHLDLLFNNASLYLDEKLVFDAPSRQFLL